MYKGAYHTEACNFTIVTAVFPNLSPGNTGKHLGNAYFLMENISFNGNYLKSSFLYDIIKPVRKSLGGTEVQRHPLAQKTNEVDFKAVHSI